MATANDVLRIAANEIGYSRWTDPANGTKYGRWYADLTKSPYFGTNGVPYCAMFVAWVLAQANQSCPGMPTAACVTALNGARNAGIIRSNKKDARPGDLVLFDWDGGLPDHIGIVEVNKGSYIQTIEGNTSSGNSGSQSNGGGVYRRTRSWSTVHSIIAVPYSGSGSGTATPSPAPSTSAKLTVDGYIGKDSVSELQRQIGTPIDGVISSQDIGNKKYMPNVTSITWGGQGSQLVVGLQKFLVRKGYSVGASGADGLMGKNTVIAIQQFLRKDCGYVKHAIDGYLGPDTAANTQNALNAGKFKG